MAKKPTPKRKRMTKLQRQIHNERTKLWANFASNCAIGTMYSAVFGLIFVTAAEEGIGNAIPIETAFLLGAFIATGLVFIFLATKTLDKLIDE